MTSLLLDPSNVSRVRDSGWAGTHYQDHETGERIVATTDGLGLGFGGSDSWHYPREVIAWPDIAAIAREVPDRVRAELVELRQRLLEHRRTYPRFAATAQAVGCGPIVAGRPLTPRQEAYIRELEAFDASGVLPDWEQTYAALNAERLALHEQALSAVLDHEPDDLLELLEDDHLRRSAGRTPAEQEREARAQEARRDQEGPFAELRRRGEPLETLERRPALLPPEVAGHASSRPAALTSPAFGSHQATSTGSVQP